MYNDQNTLNPEISPWLIERTHHPTTTATTMLEVPSFIEKKKKTLYIHHCNYLLFFALFFLSH